MKKTEKKSEEMKPKEGLYSILYKTLLDVNSALTKPQNRKRFIIELCDRLASDLKVELAMVSIPGSKEITIFHACGPELLTNQIKNLKIEIGEDSLIFEDNSIKLIELEKNTSTIPSVLASFLKRNGIKNLCLIPLNSYNKPEYVLMLCSSKEDFFLNQIIELLEHIRKDAEYALKKIETEMEKKLLLEAFEKSPIWMVITDKDGRILKVNDAVLKMTGYSREELINQKPSIFKSGKHSADFYKRMWETITSGNIFRDTIINRKKNGELLYLDSIIIPVTIDGEIYRYAGISRDITNEIMQKKRIEKLSKLYRMISNIEELLVKQKTLTDILEHLPSTVLLDSDFDVCFVVKQENNRRFIHSFSCKYPEHRELIYFIQQRMDSSPSSLKNCAFSKAFQSGSIKIREIGKNTDEAAGCPEDIKNTFVENNIKFILAIPLFEEKKPIAVLSLLSTETGFMDVEFFQLFSRIKDIVSNQITKLAVEKNNRILIKAINMSEDSIFILDSNLNIIYVNEGTIKTSEYSREELIGKPYSQLLSRTHSPEFVESLLGKLREQKPFSGLITCRTKSGKLKKLIATITPYREFDEAEYFIVTCTDITQQHQLQESLEKMLTHDPLTGMINRREFLNKVKNALHTLSHTKLKGAMCVLNTVKLKYVNQAFGFETGDKLLIEIANRLKKLIRPFDIAARLTSDRFAVFFNNLKTEEDALIAVLRLMEKLSETYQIGPRKIEIFFEAGVSLFPEDSTLADELLQKAEIAVSDAKGKSKAAIGFYKEKIKKDAERKILLKNEISEALKNNEFTVYYQPYFDISGKEVVGAEGLIRWNKPSGQIPPMEFIPYLEETGMISEVEEWLTGFVPSRMVRWKKKGLKLVPISLNISPSSFKNRDFIESLRFNINGIDPGFISLEIIERVFLDNIAYTKDILSKLRSQGFKIYMDDFGTGYSSLSHLSNTPIDCIKIDISFIRKMTQDTNTKAIVKTIITLANELNISTIAEGVEKKEQLEMLSEFGCTYIQGFIFSPPLPEEEFIKLLK